MAIKIQEFEGPLDLLLKLIEEERLAITKVAIADVTEQYLQILKEHETGMHPEMLADFLVIAARLLWYKTKALFPSLAGAGDDEGQDIETQLKRYQQYVQAAKKIDLLLQRKQALFSREHGAGITEEVLFVPPLHATPDKLKAIMLTVIASLQPLALHTREVIKKVVSLREAIRRVEGLLGQGLQTDFRALLSNVQSRTEIVVTFLAVLELVKQRTVVVKQTDVFGEIIVEKYS